MSDCATTTPPTCAVIAPVGAETARQAKAALFREVCDAHGWRAILPALDDTVADALTLATIASAELVIADLSHERPSCYFELGYAVALGKPVVLVAGAGTPLHYTDPDHRPIFYESQPALRAIVAAALDAQDAKQGRSLSLPSLSMAPTPDGSTPPRPAFVSDKETV